MKPDTAYRTAGAPPEDREKPQDPFIAAWEAKTKRGWKWSAVCGDRRFSQDYEGYHSVSCYKSTAIKEEKLMHRPSIVEFFCAQAKRPSRISTFVHPLEDRSALQHLQKREAVDFYRTKPHTIAIVGGVAVGMSIAAYRHKKDSCVWDVRRNIRIEHFSMFGGSREASIIYTDPLASAQQISLPAVRRIFADFSRDFDVRNKARPQPRAKRISPG